MIDRGGIAHETPKGPCVPSDTVLPPLPQNHREFDGSRAPVNDKLGKLKGD